MHRGMDSGRRVNPYWIIGLLLVIIVLMAVNRGGFPWPMFFVFFWIGPLLRGGRHAHEKRKHDAPDFVAQAKPKYEEPTPSSRYILTDDGEIIEMVDEPGARKVMRDE